MQSSLRLLPASQRTSYEITARVLTWVQPFHLIQMSPAVRAFICEFAFSPIQFHTYVGSWSHHHSQDTDQFYHHKDSCCPLVTIPAYSLLTWIYQPAMTLINELDSNTHLLFVWEVNILRKYTLGFVFFFFFFLIFWPHLVACGILVPQLGMEPCIGSIVLTTGKPGKSWEIHVDIFLCHYEVTLPKQQRQAEHWWEWQPSGS